MRRGAAPRWVKKTLLGEGAVQGLDGEAHRQRKAMFLDILDPDGVRRMPALPRSSFVMQVR